MIRVPMGWRSFRTTVVTLGFANLAAATLQATPICEQILADCVHDAEVNYDNCIAEPNPPYICETEYNAARDQCDADYVSCEEEQQSCTPCSSPAFTLNEEYCGDPPNYDYCGCCERENSPIIVDLGGDGVKFSSVENGVLFAIGGLEPRRRVAWPLSPDDAWLVWDRNGNGVIGDGSELFGNATICATGSTCEHGYQALAELDANADGVFDVLDPHYSDVRLWGDANRNGLSEPWELSSLANVGVLGIELDYHESSHKDKWGNRFRYQSKVRMSSAPPFRWSWDVFPVVEWR